MGNKNLGSLGIQMKDLKHQNHSEQQVYDLWNFSKSKQSQMEFPFYLRQNNDKIQVVKESQIHLHKDSLLYKIDMEGFTQLIFMKIQQTSQNKIWKFLSQNDNQALIVGDCIKLGSIQLEFHMLVLNNQEVESNQPLTDGKKNNSKFETVQNMRQSQMIKCRICLETAQSDDNPLISLCHCQGSVKYTHFQCMKRWILFKVKQTEKINYSYLQFEPFFCDLCKSALPTFFTNQNRTFSLISSTNVSPPYALFQHKFAFGHKSKKHSFYLISLNDNVSLSIGRGSESSIQFHNSNNTTVSRKHSSLFYLHKKLYIRDLNSKYGTLYFSPYKINFSFTAQNGIYFCLKQNIIKISRFRDSWMPIIGPSVNCCAASMKFNVRIYEDQDEKRSLETSRALFDFEIFD